MKKINKFLDDNVDLFAMIALCGVLGMCIGCIGRALTHL